MADASVEITGPSETVVVEVPGIPGPGGGGGSISMPGTLDETLANLAVVSRTDTVPTTADTWVQGSWSITLDNLGIDLGGSSGSPRLTTSETGLYLVFLQSQYIGADLGPDGHVTATATVGFLASLVNAVVAPLQGGSVQDAMTLPLGGGTEFATGFPSSSGADVGGQLMLNLYILRIL